MKLNMKQLFTAAFSLVLLQTACAQNIADKMDELVSAYSKQNRFNGTVLVARGGNVVFAKGYGFRNADQKIPNDTSTIFQIGSVTKQFTAAIIMQLQEENKLSVKDKLDKYFKGFPNGNEITIEHLLTHTSGLHNYTSDSALMSRDVSVPISESEMLDLFKKYEADFAPGTKWNYSNTAYSLLGYIIKKVEKKPYETVVRERIFRPLGMNSTGFDFIHLSNAKKANGYFLLAGATVQPAPVVDSTIAFSAGAIYTTVNDLLKWERAVSAKRLLKPESWNAVFTPVKNKYGYGWVIDSLHGTRLTAHSGGIHGFASYLLRFPEQQLAIILMDNASSRDLSQIARSLAAIVMEKPYKVPEAKKTAQVSVDVMKQYVGEYELVPGFIITVRLDGEQLKAQATGQSEFDLFAEKENVFFLKVVEAKVEFVKDDKGIVTEMILYQNGQQPRGKKIK
jgi:CubicO group peptidase (beta-lactamase class C family)